MKKILLILFVTVEITLPQTAQNYFPSQTGRVWNFKATPLDSLNKKIDSLIFYEVDSFAVVTNYSGKLASIVLSKIGPAFSINLQPYLDSSFYSFNGSEAFSYISISDFFDIAILGKTNSRIESPLVNNGWFSVYRFAQSVNQTYIIFSFDTTVTINSTVIPLRIVHEGKRLNDENISTLAGNFLCKKFVITTRISYLLILPPPLPPLPVEFVSVDDTSWISESYWIVKNIVPSENVDLSFAGLGSYFIPGLEKETIQSVPTDIYEDILNPMEFSLEQNYPNPFNPITTLSFVIGHSSFITLKIYDILGNEIATIVNGNLPAGSYKYQWNAEGRSSGIYFYRLTVTSQSSSFTLTKKMILEK